MMTDLDGYVVKLRMVNTNEVWYQFYFCLFGSGKKLSATRKWPVYARVSTQSRITYCRIRKGAVTRHSAYLLKANSNMNSWLCILRDS